ncbi:MAG: tRNA pseudouridine(54/55) synthase Pus10 [Planctomycetota bacterium]|nr:tRNA pseudouridine(54/55) synthase Pus10 [Planctomycetota bacterium]
MPHPFARDDVVASIVEATRDHEFTTFVLGYKRLPGLKYPEEEPETHRELKTTVGLELLRVWPHRSVDFYRPEMRLEVGVGPQGPEVELRPSPLFLGGRYRKLSRDIPASRWMHLSCDGRGCDGCSYTGNLCGPSIQELFSGPILRQTGGERTFFHGLGREDTDARMLGEGRPFVMEVSRPRRRTIDAERLLRETTDVARGYAELLEPRIVERSTVRQVKEADAEKTYRAWVQLSGSPPEDTRERLESLAGEVIEQYSPTRVMHRRGRSKLRRRRVVSARWIGEVEDRIVWQVRAESGTYIKELISGDEGRTRPSVTERLGVPATCIALDVMAVHWTAPWESTGPMPAAGNLASERR